MEGGGGREGEGEKGRDTILVTWCSFLFFCVYFTFSKPYIILTLITVNFFCHFVGLCVQCFRQTL